MPNRNNHRNLLGSYFSAPSKFYFYSLPKNAKQILFSIISQTAPKNLTSSPKYSKIIKRYNHAVFP